MERFEKNLKPLAFVGKGVCFDTGGYSLKPQKFMEDMTYDMAGSATVVGLKSLATRKAKINAVGIVGLVENMVVEMLKDLEILLNHIVAKL